MVRVDDDEGEPYPPLPTAMRQALLWRFEDPTDRKAVEQVGKILADYLRWDTWQTGPDPTRDEHAAWTEAVVADVMACVEDLRELARPQDRGGHWNLSPRLRAFAARYAEELHGLAQRMYRELAGLEASDPAPVRGP